MSWKLVISARQDGQQAMEICLSPCPLGKTMQFLVNCQLNHCITGVKGKTKSPWFFSVLFQLAKIKSAVKRHRLLIKEAVQEELA